MTKYILFGDPDSRVLLPLGQVGFACEDLPEDELWYIAPFGPGTASDGLVCSMEYSSKEARDIAFSNLTSVLEAVRFK